MIRRKFIALVSALFVLVAISGYAQISNDSFIPRQVVLTWQSDPSTSMTITWRTDNRNDVNNIRYLNFTALLTVNGKHWRQKHLHLKRPVPGCIRQN